MTNLRRSSFVVRPSSGQPHKNMLRIALLAVRMGVLMKAYGVPIRRASHSLLVVLVFGVLGVLLSSLNVFALERWVVGPEGESWAEVMEARESRSVETPQGGDWLQPERADSSKNLSLDVWDRGGWYTGTGLMIWSNSIDGGFDDDLETAAINIVGSRANITLDLSAPYPANRIRFYPRPRFPQRFMQGYALYVNDGAIQAVFSSLDKWTLASETNAGDTRRNRIDWQPLLENRENLESMVDLRFPTRYLRYVQLRDFTSHLWEVAELEVCGEGYVRSATYVSKVIDLEQTADFGDLIWSMEIDPGAKAALRTRTGRTADPFVYYRLTGIGPTGQTRVRDENGNGTARDEYDRLRDDQGDRVLDTDNWSAWSPPYDVSADRRTMLSPGPRRYVEFKLDMQAGDTFTDGVRVHQLVLEYKTPPIAREIVAEIAPGTISPGALTSFTYALRANLDPEHTGFDALEISTPVRIAPDAVREVTVDGDPVVFSLEIGDDAFVVYLPQRIDRDGQRMTVYFESRAFVYGTRFSGRVFDSRSPEAAQSVLAGDATSELESDGLSVTWSLTGDLIGSLDVGPNPLTPNGDRVNDELQFTYSVLQLLSPVTVTVSVYDLSGTLVWQDRDQQASGPVTTVWRGENQAGIGVPPGIYVYRISVRAAEGEDTRAGTVAVVY